MTIFRAVFGHFYKKKYKKLLTSGIRDEGDYEVGLREDYYLDRYRWTPVGTIIEEGGIT